MASGNITPEADTITLAAGTIFALTAVNNTTNGPTRLPTIAAGEDLTIFGNGGTIERSTEVGTPSFRLLDVTSGASLALENLTLQGGLAYGSGVSARGGAVFNQGTLTLTGVTVQNNAARGVEGRRGERPVGKGDAAGGGMYSSGALLVADSTIQNNQAVGGPGRPFGGAVDVPWRGGDLRTAFGPSATTDGEINDIGQVGDQGPATAVARVSAHTGMGFYVEPSGRLRLSVGLRML